MTLNDLISEFEITYDIGSLGLPGFSSDEIIKLLELAQYRIISQKMTGNNPTNTLFPDTNKRIDDLSGLIISADSGSNPEDISWAYLSLTSGIYIAIFPSDYLHLIEFSIQDSDGKWQYAKQVKLSEFNRFVQAIGNVLPYVRIPVYSFIGNDGGNRKIRVCVDINYKTTVDYAKASCLYIKKPTNLENAGLDPDSTLADFNDDVYHEIVASAVDHAISIATPNKAQISQMQLNKSE